MGAQSDPVVKLLPHIVDARGRLTATDDAVLGFETRRAFWVDNCTAPRGGHAHKRCWQAMVAVAGRVEVFTTRGDDMRVWWLCWPYEALVVPPGWTVTYSVQNGGMLLVLCSEPYDETDYIR